MSHWRTEVGRPNDIQGAGDHDAEYFGGWAVSGTAILVAITLAWIFQF